MIRGNSRQLKNWRCLVSFYNAALVSISGSLRYEGRGGIYIVDRYTEELSTGIFLNYLYYYASGYTGQLVFSDLSLVIALTVANLNNGISHVQWGSSTVIMAAVYAWANKRNFRKIQIVYY